MQGHLLFHYSPPPWSGGIILTIWGRIWNLSEITQKMNLYCNNLYCILWRTAFSHHQSGCFTLLFKFEHVKAYFDTHWPLHWLLYCACTCLPFQWPFIHPTAVTVQCVPKKWRHFKWGAITHKILNKSVSFIYDHKGYFIVLSWWKLGCNPLFTFWETAAYAKVCLRNFMTQLTDGNYKYNHALFAKY